VPFTSSVNDSARGVLYAPGQPGNWLAEGDIEAALDAETLQEILHRYRSLNRWVVGQLAFELAGRLFPDILAITGSVMDRAKAIAEAIHPYRHATPFTPL
jgi:hypothetical protein